MIVDAVVKTSNISLMNLDLGECDLTVEGAKHVARLIESNNTITILTVSDTFELGGWKASNNALKTNTTALETLSFAFNKIGDEEAVLIFEGLQECKNLCSIDLKENEIGDGGQRLFKMNKLTSHFFLRIKYQEIVDDIKELLELRAKGSNPRKPKLVRTTRRSYWETKILKKSHRNTRTKVN